MLGGIHYFKHGFQLNTVFGLSTNRVSALLAGFQASEVAERADCCCKLCVLRLVGLAILGTHRIHIVVQFCQRSND